VPPRTILLKNWLGPSEPATEAPTEPPGYDAQMTFTKRLNFKALFLATALFGFAAFSFSAGQAGATTASSAAATKSVEVTMISDCSDCGEYIWLAKLDKIDSDPGYNNLNVHSGDTKIFFIWPALGGAEHNVKLKARLSTPGLSFPVGTGSASPFKNIEPTDFTWPEAGWTPEKKGTYFLYCSQHSAMFMRVIVKPLVAKVKPARTSVRAGTRSIVSTVTADSATPGTAKIVLCKNSSCSKIRVIASKAVRFHSGSNRLSVATRRLAAGRYQLRVLVGKDTTSSAFTVKR